MIANKFCQQFIGCMLSVAKKIIYVQKFCNRDAWDSLL